MHINKKFIPIKAHYFFFMAGMGPILPQLPVIGKQLGISPEVMGSITGILPLTFLLAKPAFGLLVDMYRQHRKAIFMLLILIMTVSYAVMNFIPAKSLLKLNFSNFSHFSHTTMDTCNVTDFGCEDNKGPVRIACTSSCTNATIKTNAVSSLSEYKICSFTNSTSLENCDLNCDEIVSDSCLYNSVTFWGFVLLMSIGTIGFNVINSISDAICFDVIGDDGDYGRQRVWGTIGFGTTALIAGYVVDLFSTEAVSYTPAFIIMAIFSTFDLIACIKLKLPIIPVPDNIFKDLKALMKDKTVVTFITFAIFAGVLDGLIIYFLFWYLEELAVATGTQHVKLIEGLIVAAETLGGEVIFFSISGKILERFGHVHCFSMCFINYALRLGLISLAPNPWWILPIEFFLQGPTYALTYTTIVAYANELAPPGASATMQGIAAGMDDGVGYAIGSVLGGVLFKYLGNKATLQVFSAFGLFCSVAHALLHRTVLRATSAESSFDEVQYKDPEKAYKATYGEK